MNENISMLREVTSFKDFLFKNKGNRLLILLAVTAFVIQFAIFKYLYPYASYIHGDSFSYLNAADKNLTINTYLIGYSKFLRLFSVFARPDYVIVAFQYLFIQFSTLFLLFTIFFFYKVGRPVQYILLGFVVINPLVLYLGNLISSDGLFLALSITWFALLLWISHKPSKKIIIWHAIVLFLAFTVRYNAMIYPFIAAFAFWLSKLSLRVKLFGIGLYLILCGWFVGLTMFQYKRLTSLWQYSPFSGWQMANNAMYAYRYVDSTDRISVPKRFKELDNIVRLFFDKTRDTTKFWSEKIMAGTFYMWSPGMPLMKYRDSLFKKDTAATELKKWASMGPYYKEYGIYIIKQYPWHFLKYFAWPNTKKYYAPPIEFLQFYNSGKEIVDPIAQKWFAYKSRKINTRMKGKAVWILGYYPILSGIVNLLLLSFLIFYIMLKGWRHSKIFKKTILLGSSVWILNAIFTITASSAALRFQAFPIVLTTISVLLLIDWMLQTMASMKKQTIHIDSADKELKDNLLPSRLA